MSALVRSSVAPLLGLVAFLGAAGCGTSGLDVRYPVERAQAAMLAAAAPRVVDLSPVVDRRLDPKRIGIGPKNADIVTSRPVADIMREALGVELSENGHAGGSEGGDVIVATEVEEFWLDVVSGHSKVQYTGRVAIALAVTDGRTGHSLFARRYTGIRRREADEVSGDAARDVMNDALARTMRDLATDPDFVAALAGPRASDSPR
jgi:uncharacterized lipoprotein YajG